MSAPAGMFTPKPGAAPVGRMIAAQVALETRMLLRNGEQLLLTVIIPTVLLVLFSAVDLLGDLGSRADAVDTGPGGRVDFLAPGILALSVMSTAFTSQAIATAFERRYGVLKRLGVSPLPRWALLAGKTLSVLLVEAMQVGLVVAVALSLGWEPEGSPAAVALLLLVGTAAFSGLGLLMGGTLPAEATLAGANLVYLLLLVCGGVVVPLDRFPEGVADVLELTPTAALATGLRDVLTGASGMPWSDLGILGVWAVAGLAAAAALFRWE
jgi:ABC-2 type transport system permease protein